MSDLQMLLSAKLVAVLLGISEASVWRLSALGTIPTPIKISPGVTRWDRAEIDQFLESKKAERNGDVGAEITVTAPAPRLNPVPSSIRADAKRPGRPRKFQEVSALA
jgi:predicted DNA-binding transcriptional regulator AlpA